MKIVLVIRGMSLKKGKTFFSIWDVPNVRILSAYHFEYTINLSPFYNTMHSV